MSAEENCDWDGAKRILVKEIRCDPDEIGDCEYFSTSPIGRQKALRRAEELALDSGVLTECYAVFEERESGVLVRLADAISYTASSGEMVVDVFHY
jgi:hypothetical protein